MIRRKQGKGDKGMNKKGVVHHKSGATIKFGTDAPLLESEFYQGKPRRYNKRVLAVMNRMASKMTKTAGCSARGDTMMSSPNFYHPEYEPSSLLMPRDPIEINAWARYFYKYDPIVSTATDAHAELPISTIRLTTPNSKDKKKNNDIREHYEDMCSTSNLDLFNKLLQIGVEYYKLGNVFPYAQWCENKMMWNKLTLLDPDYVEIDKLQFSDKMRIDLRPNDRLKQIINNGPSHPKTGLLYQAIPEDIRELISTGRKIPLNTNPERGSSVAHIAYKMADYDTLGTGLIERNFKTLVYKDRLRQAQDAIASRHLTPKHLIWAENTGNIDTEIIREQIDNAFADPDYAIITNFQLNWELVGTGQGMMQLDSEWNWINEELMIGLMINRSFLLGEGSFANGQTALEVMNQRYAIYRERLESYIIRHLFLPMAIRNDYCEYEPGTVKKEKVKKYIYPRIKWNRLNLVDDTSHKQMLSQMVTQGQIDLETWLEMFGLDPETIKNRLKKWEGTVLDVNYFEEMRGVASEVGRVLAPAIAKARALERGIELPEEEDGEFRFSDGSRYKMVKTGNSEMMVKKSEKKTAETREERESERTQNRSKHNKEKVVKNLEPDTKKKFKPPRNDLSKPKLFADNDDQIVVISGDKEEELLNNIKQDEISREEWQDKMSEMGFNSNSRRATLAMENALLSLNEKNTFEDRLECISKYVPQILAMKIEEDGTLMQKTDKAKELFAEKIQNLSNNLSNTLTKRSVKETKMILRNTIESFFKTL